MHLNVKHLTLRDTASTILDDINCSVSHASITSIIGPSGAGKTTLLRCVAGLQKYSGTITFNNKSIDTTPTRKRNIGMVTQDMSLFPHMTIFENIAYPLKIRATKLVKNTVSTIKDTTKNILTQCKINHLANRFPQEISGGEQQRAALARALVYEPQLLLLDEPFGALDIALRYDLLHWLKDLLTERQTTTLFVTHDIREAKFMSNKALFLDKGKKIGYSSFQELATSTDTTIRSFFEKVI